VNCLHVLFKFDPKSRFFIRHDVLKSDTTVHVQGASHVSHSTAKISHDEKRFITKTSLVIIHLEVIIQQNCSACLLRVCQALRTMMQGRRSFPTACKHTRTCVRQVCATSCEQMAVCKRIVYRESMENNADKGRHGSMSM
jgi:hypothetical protein